MCVFLSDGLVMCVSSIIPLLNNVCEYRFLVIYPFMKNVCEYIMLLLFFSFLLFVCFLILIIDLFMKYDTSCIHALAKGRGPLKRLSL